MTTDFAIATVLNQFKRVTTIVLLSVFNSKNLVNGMGERFFAILKTSMRSERFLLSSRDHIFNLARRSIYEIFCIPGMSLVNLC